MWFAQEVTVYKNGTLKSQNLDSKILNYLFKCTVVEEALKGTIFRKIRDVACDRVHE